MNNRAETSSSFYSGLSGLQLPIPKYQFPPPYQEASRLTYYATFFNSIEINSSFYKLPGEITVARWVDTVPEDFRFTFKLWKQVTHQKELYFEKTDVASFLRSIMPAARKKGCLLVQFPPSLDKVNILQLAKLLSCLREADTQDWNIAVEFRNNSWYEEKVYRLLETCNAAIVIQDIPRSATPLLDYTGSVVYVRFHGPTGNYRGGYDESFLSEYATYVNEWLEEGKKVYVYFNNTMGDAFKNLRTLNKSIFEK
ncbi:MAG TPA: DUF72 domain-containing protein [Ferruginibacter sp.]|nr:DUF72 domain-containing protein [Ferruginibacter sp.]